MHTALRMKINGIIWLESVIDKLLLGDYWDLTREAEFEVDIQRRVFLTALEPELAKRLSDCARKQGVTAETLINVWLSEKLAESVQSKQ